MFLVKQEEEAPMREDMFKVIVERPRRGARLRLNRARLDGADDLPARIGMKRLRAINGTKSKSLNENLKPLKRYLMKQANRPWDKVYMEICAHLDADSTVKQHVRDHLEDFVATNIVVGRDGAWMAAEKGWFGPQKLWRQPLYVDPIDGILKLSARRWKKLGVEPRRWRWRRPADDPNIILLSDDVQLRRIAGLWFEIGFGDVGLQESAFDVLKRSPVVGPGRYARSKRQLSSDELRARGLANA